MKKEKRITKNSNERKKEPKVISIECFFCHTKFEINKNKPIYEKVFYYRCPNCGSEIKIKYFHDNNYESK